MKIKEINAIKNIPSRNINCNTLIKDISKMPSNLIRKELTTGEKLVRAMGLFNQVLLEIAERNKRILEKLERLEGLLGK